MPLAGLALVFLGGMGACRRQASEAAGTNAGARGDAGDALGTAGRVSNPEWVAMRPLTSREFDRTVLDLLGLDTHPSQMFPDVPTGSDHDDFDVIAAAADPVNDFRYSAWAVAVDGLAAAAFADPLLRARVLTCDPAASDANACTRAIIRTFGQHAWRRPLSPEEIDGLAAFAARARDAGATFEAAIQSVVTAMLSSAPFLFRLEIDPDPAASAPRPLTPYELASRLSYLLWSSMPDDRLFALAADGSLLSDAVLRGEVDRLIDDPRSQSFVEGFGGAWLGEVEITVEPDPTHGLVKDWDALAAAMSRELLLYISEFLHGDVSVATFLAADINFVDATLAALYGIPTDGLGVEPKRVVDTTDARRGYLGLGATLALTSHTGRTSPTERGRWILSRLLCEPLAEPPIDTPDTPQNLPAGQTIRQRAEELQADAACGECHREMDGLGLALESFGPIGAFRSQYDDGTPVDPRGWLADGTEVVGEAALADALDADPRFLSCVAHQAVRYALNRDLDTKDGPELEALISSWTQGVPTLRALLEEIVLSEPFRFRRAEEAP